jgi:Transposase DDE domain
VPSVHAGWNVSGRPLAFVAGDCGPCPARGLCTTGKRRQLTLMPRALAEAQAAARAAEATIPFRADYPRRAGVEGTMHQAASHGARRARYRGLPKTLLRLAPTGFPMARRGKAGFGSLTYSGGQFIPGTPDVRS